MYVPTASLRQSDIRSILSIAMPSTNDKNWMIRVDSHHSRRTMLRFLLSIKATPNNNHLLQFITKFHPKFDWSTVEQNYQKLKTSIEFYQKQYHAEKLGNYWQLKIPINFADASNSRKYICQYRSNGFRRNELKIYWNYDEIESLRLNSQYNPITDSDARKALLDQPVEERQHSGKIKFINNGIQNAVFNVPHGKQVIVLDFADERMPGGYFLENASTQEEVILYHSDGYRALLDLKYEMMDGGYMLPEYGVAYIKRVRFFQAATKKERVTDLIVAACYDLSTAKEGLYQPPLSDPKEIRGRTRQKFQAIIASAVANTEGNGSNTYLLLGPIGTGAFGNDETMIAEIFSDILNNPLMNSTKPIRYAFEEIWFVSIDTLQEFEGVFKKCT